MLELSANSKFYVQYNSWHAENEIAIVRKKDKYMDALILNKAASELWQIAARRAQWTMSQFTEAVENEVGPSNEPTETRIQEFLEQMIQAGLILRHKTSIFQDEIT
jgi:hypothetical protein